MPQTEAADAASVVYAEVADRIGDGEQAGWITDAIFYASDLYQVDPLLVAAMMEQESSFSMEATSSAGAIGLMQLMPRTAAGIGIDPYDPLQNVLGGVSTYGHSWIVLPRGGNTPSRMPLPAIIQAVKP